jgi:ubiquinone/menaquinone biosynthesis C-methylase UbiE
MRDNGMLSGSKAYLKILNCAVKKNGIKQFFFYLSNLDTYRFIEYSKTLEFLKDNNHSGMILDLGSGYSILPETLQANLDSDILCLDLTQSASKHQSNPLKNINAIKGDMSCLPFKSSSIPIVVAISSIEHVPEDALVFQEIGRILVEGGTAIVSIPFSSKEVKIQKLNHSPLLLGMLHKFQGFWQLILDKNNTEYFITQTATDSIMKSYNHQEIAKILTASNLTLKDSYLIIAKPLLSGFHKIFPPGWFVLKDFIFGLLFWKLGNVFFNNEKNADGIIMKLRKEQGWSGEVNHG